MNNAAKEGSKLLIFLEIHQVRQGTVLMRETASLNLIFKSMFGI